MSKEPTYTEKDLQIIEGDAVSFIRERSNQFVGDHQTGAYFVARLVQDLMLLDAAPLHIKNSGSWYFVSADKDWLWSDQDGVSLEPFHRLIPLPIGGRLHDRAEVLLTALTDAVVTSGIDGTTWISGDPAHWSLPSELDLSLPLRKGRVVGFHFQESAAK